MDAAATTVTPAPAGTAVVNGTKSKPVPTESKARPSTNIAAVAGAVFNAMADEQKKLNISLLPDFVEAVSQAGASDLSLTVDQDIVASVAGDAPELTYDQTMAIVGMMQASLQPSPSALSMSLTAERSITSGVGGVSHTPLKKALSTNKSYLETGSLAFDESVVAYMQKLQELRKRCETEGRYAEAKAAATRLAQLRTAQVARLRQELVTNQERELQTVNGVYEEETAKFVQAWNGRIAEYEHNFAIAVVEMKGAHEAQREKYSDEVAAKRPTKPKPSKEYLEQKGREKSLAKNREYTLAMQVKEAADELYVAELEQTQAAFEAEQKLKMAKFMGKQQAEFEALLQRGARGRDELELKRIAETEKRMNRFRNIMAELESLHNLEVVQLESFLDAQVQAGKAAPLKDGGAYRRRREALYSATF